MEQKYKTQYTKAASIEMSKFQNEQAKLLEDIIVSEKKYPGADFIEITASDIQDYGKKFTVKSENRKKPLTYLILKTYFLLGLGIAVYGLFYTQIQKLLNDTPEQIGYLIGGTSLMFGSLIALTYIRYRDASSRVNYDRSYNKYIEKIESLEVEDLKTLSALLNNVELYNENNKSTGSKNLHYKDK